MNLSSQFFVHSHSQNMQRDSEGQGPFDTLFAHLLGFKFNLLQWHANCQWAAVP